MTIAQLPLHERRHANQQLFSDHYLNTLLPNRPDWKMLALDARPTMEAIRAIFTRYTPSNNEAQTEKDLVRPILDILGHTYEIQAPLRHRRASGACAEQRSGSRSARSWRSLASELGCPLRRFYPAREIFAL